MFTPEPGEEFRVRVRLGVVDNSGAPSSLGTSGLGMNWRVDLRVTGPAPSTATIRTGYGIGIMRPTDPAPNRSSVTAITNPFTVSSAGELDVFYWVTNSHGGGGAAYPIHNSGGLPLCGANPPIASTPYLKAYGGEVHAGGVFGSEGRTSCDPRHETNSNNSDLGGIYTYTRSMPAFSGSSSQLTISSLLQVNEMYSASHRSAAPSPPKGLTFANTGTSNYGGESNKALCATDYFNDTKYEDGEDGVRVISGTSLPTSFAANQGVVQYHLEGDQVIAPPPGLIVPVGTQIAVYVDGNAYIRRDITYAAGAASWDDHPYFVVIARGDIYIDNDITRLDGLYIAQDYEESGASRGGTIYTCTRTETVGTFNESEVYGECQNQLAVNGGLMAKNIKFLRMRGTLNQSAPNELPDFNTGLAPTTQIAEIINYTPEMYLGRSPLRGGGNDSRYDYIRSLPPVY